MPKEARFSINFIRNIIYYSAGLGKDIASLCKEANFPPERLATPDEMVSGTVVERVWQTAIARVGDPELGLHIGEALQPSSLGLIGFVMLGCTMLGSALDKLARYWDLMSNATSIRFRDDGRIAVLELVVHDLPGNFLLWNRHPVESSLSAATGLIRALTGRQLLLSDAASTYAPPANMREYERIFGRRPRFNAEANLISFPVEALSWPVLHSTPGLLEQFEGQIRKRLNANPSTTCDRVRTVLAKSLRGNVPDLAAVAKALLMSERALQRELQKEGTTFRQVLDELRQDLALEYLRDSRQHSITDISFLLGFSEPSVLHRYFRRWMGMTPQQYRLLNSTGATATEYDPT
jgi:AraC-like DNA-binding protein